MYEVIDFSIVLDGMPPKFLQSLFLALSTRKSYKLACAPVRRRGGGEGRQQCGRGQGKRMHVTMFFIPASWAAAACRIRKRRESSSPSCIRLEIVSQCPLLITGSGLALVFNSRLLSPIVPVPTHAPPLCRKSTSAATSA